ncbi:MAG: hypothetical protein WCK00_03475 [Deltaproteobacteria bacterium]
MPLLGRVVGNSPSGGMKGGHEQDARGVTAIRQVAGASLAYCIHLNYHFQIPFVSEPDIGPAGQSII